jgi:hypothetical protein
LAKPVKLILVTAKDHPHHKLWTKLLEELAKETGLETETRIEDYLLLTEHGDTDDLGMPWLPQILVELDNGEIRVLISKLPLNKALQPDLGLAKKEALERLKELGSQ